MSFIKIWVHVVWLTKNKYPYLTKEIRDKLIYHIIKNGDTKGIHINFINGYFDHLHLLISMKPEQSIAEIIHFIKGESSYWVNKNKLTQIEFKWQPEYYVAAVSSQNVEKVRKYIKNQEKHHYIKTLDDEIEEFIKANDISNTGF